MLHVLFVDDEPQILSALRASLRPYRTALTPYFSSSAQEALEILSRSTSLRDTGSLIRTGAPLDAVVSDVRMPSTDGASLLDAIGKTHPAVLRLALTGQVDATTSLRLAWSAHQVLTKPTPAAVLADLLTGMLDNRDMLADAPLLRALAAPLALPVTPRMALLLKGALQQKSRGVLEKILSSSPSLALAVLRLSRTGLFGAPDADVSPVLASRRMDWPVLETLLIHTPVLDAPWLMMLENIAALARFLAHELAQKHPEFLPWFSTPDAPASPHVLETSALLADIGLFALVPALPERYKLLQVEPWPTIWRQADYEEMYASTTHGDYGSLLMSFWGMPRAPVELVAASHLSPEPQSPVAVLAFINTLSLWALDPSPPPEAAEHLGVLAGFLNTPVDYWMARARILSGTSHS